ncbi:hypothetical protein [Crocosphaera sp.]|uniref:hypothetical protein n=1 Tax=Crocosphaera sp. TaxID=2729996 RepID=UPI00261ACFA7|nr:hypothetical protein [Crocosphaera sp.]MDJ0579709.1 hypothetical protein [Crocosphaera sp.]
MVTRIFSINARRGSASKSPGAIAHSGFAGQLTGFIQDYAIAINNILLQASVDGQIC